MKRIDDFQQNQGNRDMLHADIICQMILCEMVLSGLRSLQRYVYVFFDIFVSFNEKLHMMESTCHKR